MMLEILKGHDKIVKANDKLRDLGVIITGDLNAYIPYQKQP